MTTVDLEQNLLVVGSCAIATAACTAREVLIGLHGCQSEWSVYHVIEEHGTENESRPVNQGVG